ncbi:branched-chain amino acid ABC transporter permease [Ciceribacter sp. RN22]|uniref:branched-chain amino acid ABC transporter permease n=1 Tax=Ciceribacter sp. RN22 TaxID=2954932 RepID=UPI0020923702|nr:branched-chain amino acid ABC transporter permease [Ciceribacter sp. RN22]MCO6177776.1 branched-chain amino acid ABC transporter permease [Ciceribacter sp. RN22]
MAYLLQQLANAVPVAALYAALAFGYSLAFAMTRRADITFGALFAFAGQIYVFFAHAGWNQLYLVLPAALALGAAASLLYTFGAAVLIGRHVMLPLRRASPNTVIVASLGVLVVLEEMVRIAMESRGLWLSPFLNREVVFWADGGFKVTLTLIQLLNAAIMVSLVFVGHLLLTRTRLGRVWRGVADDPLAAEMCGTDARAVFVWSYVASAAIAAVCGVLATSYYGTMDFGAGLMFGLKVVLVAAAGGYSVPLRSALGAAAVALAETLWSGYGPILWRDLVIAGGLVTVLVISRQERAIP